MERISPALLNLLLNASWQIAVVAVAAEMSTRLLRGWSARERHRVWVAALLLSIGLPLLNVARPMFQFKQRPATLATQRISATDEIPLIAPIDGAGAVTPQTNQTHSVPQRLAMLIVGAYLAIAMARSAALLRAWWSTRRLLRSTYEIEAEGTVARVVARCVEQTEIGRVRLLASKDVDSPITLGMSPAIVVIPEKLLHEQDEALLTSAIGHELIHIVRNDYILNFIYRMLAIPLSFHPAAWFIQRRIEQTRELRCDEVVTERLLSPTAYARSLVELAGQALQRPAVTVAVGITDADILEERIMTMLKKPNHSSAKRVLLLATAALIFALPCIAAAPYALHIDVQQTSESAAIPITVGRIAYTPITQQADQAAQPAQQQQQNPESQQIKRRSADYEAGVVAGTMYKMRGFAYAPDGQQSSAAEQEARAREKRERDDLELSPEEREARIIRMKQEIAFRSKYLTELAKAAKITMQQAIDIATREVPGKVFESGLVGERSFITKQTEGGVALTKNTINSGTPQYRIVILAGDENNPERHIVFVDAVSGNVVRSVVE